MKTIRVSKQLVEKLNVLAKSWDLSIDDFLKQSGVMDWQPRNPPYKRKY